MNFLQAAQAAKRETPSNHGNSPSPIIGAIHPHYYQFIFHGSHEGGSESVKFAQVEYFCGVLNSNKTPEIYFDIRKIRLVANGSFNFKGDSSTAMALDFIDRFPILSKRDGKRDPEKIFACMRLRYQNSSFVFRTRQAAFNTLCKAEDCREDFHTNQLNCLLKLHHRRCKWSTKSLGVKSGNFSSEIEKTFRALENGHFLIRMDQSGENKLKEEGVHTVVLIRQGLKSYVYDPKFGCVKLVEKTEHLFLKSMILMYRENLQIETVRFFKVAKRQIVCRPSELSQRLPEIKIFQDYAILKYPKTGKTEIVQFLKEEEEQIVRRRGGPSLPLPKPAVNHSPPSNRDRKLFGHFIKQLLTDANDLPKPVEAAQKRLSPEVSEVE